MNIRKLARPAAALLAAAALMAGIPELRMEAQAAFRELNAALDQTQTLEAVPAADSSK